MRSSEEETVLLQREELKDQEASVALTEMLKILSSLANEDALRIFFEAEKGIESSTEAIRKLDLTQKRYYVWLKRLMEAGLIEKRDNAYVLTMLGRLCQRLGGALLNAVSQRDQLALADKLMKSDTLSVKEKEEVLGAISTKELFGPASLADVVHEVKMIGGYDHFVDEVLEMMKRAKESVYIASNKFDLRIMEAAFNLIDRGVRFFYLANEEKGSTESIQAMRILLLQPQIVSTIRKLIDAKEVNARLTEQHVSYCFIVADGEYGIIELPHPTSRDFYVAFKFRNALFCQKLTEAFYSLYEKAKEDPRIGFAKRFLSLHK